MLSECTVALCVSFLSPRKIDILFESKALNLEKYSKTVFQGYGTSDEDFRMACKHGHRGLAEYILHVRKNSPPSIRCLKKNNHDAFYWASRMDRTECFEVMCRMGYSPPEDLTVLKVGERRDFLRQCSLHSLRRMQKVFNRNDDTNLLQFIFRMAVMQGCVEIFRELVENTKFMRSFNQLHVPVEKIELQADWFRNFKKLVNVLKKEKNRKLLQQLHRTSSKFSSLLKKAEDV